MALVELRSISKSFGGVRALQDVSFSIEPGEIHGFCGENGAGKSTLNKILSGSLAPDAGEVWIDGAVLEPGSVAASEAAGIAIIHQESTAFPQLNAAENIFIGREPRRVGGLLLDRRTMRRESAAMLRELGEDFSRHRPLGELTVAQRQMVQIARALSQSCRLLIMDEPTSSLSEKETDVLFRLMRRLRGQGVTILYVSHRMPEIFALADRVTVLRDGRHVATEPVAAVDEPRLIGMMVGRELASTDAALSTADAGGAPALEVDGLHRKGEFADIHLTVRRGEVVGLGGLVGAGRSELAQTLFGIRVPDGGCVRVDGRVLPAGEIRAAMRAGLAFVPEDRQHEGLALAMSIRENASLAVLGRLAAGPWLSPAREKRHAAELARRMAVNTRDVDLPTGALSGGNQQKVLLGKWLATDPAVLILDEPTRGIDVGAKAEIHRLIRRMADQGKAVLVISSEMPELLALSDRILVMREGRLTGELDRDEATQEKILQLALPDAAQAEAPEVATDAEPGRRARRSIRQGLGLPAARREFGIVLLLFLAFCAIAIVNPSFFAAGNLLNLLVKAAPVMIVACGLAMVIATREIDISVGSLRGLLAVVLGVLVGAERLGLPGVVGIAGCLALGTLVGCGTGLLVAVGKVPSILVTLGLLFALRGLSEVIMAGEWITQMPATARWPGMGDVAGIPVSVLVAFVVVAGVHGLIRHTPLGLRLIAVGDDPDNARLLGLSPERIRVFVFACTGFLTALAMLVSDTQLSTIESGIGVGFELLVVTCVVVGGASIQGGNVRLAGAVLAVLLLTNVSSILIFLKLPQTAYWEQAIQGGCILVSVLVDQLSRRGGSRS